MRRVIYAFSLIIILASLGGFPNYLAMGQWGGSQSVTVTVIATPLYSLPTGGSWSPPALVTEQGVFTNPVTLQSKDEIVKLSISKDTVALTKEGIPVGKAETTEAIAISITAMEAPPPPPVDAHIIGRVYDLGPDGLTFSQPVTITLTYDKSQIPPGISEESLVIASRDAVSRQWIPLEVSVVNYRTNTITGLTSHFTPFTVIAYTRPPAFATSNLSITPSEADIGERVSITVLVANTGGYGSYEVTLEINGVVEATKKVTIFAGDSKLVSFDIVKDTAGTYSLGVNGLTGAFEVKQPVEPTPAKPISWWLIGGIIAAVVAIAFAIFFLRRG